MSRLFAEANLRRCAGFALVAAASSVSWLAPVLLGIARELGPRASLPEVMGVYGIAVGLVFAGLTTLAFSRLILRDGARSSSEPAAVGPRGGLA